MLAGIKRQRGGKKLEMYSMCVHAGGNEIRPKHFAGSGLLKEEISAAVIIIGCSFQMCQDS